MVRIGRIIVARFFGFACALALVSCSQPEKDLKSLPTITADKAHQIEIESKNNLSYEVPSGIGFVIDTSAFKNEYAKGSSTTLDAEVSHVIRLDPVAPSSASPLSVELVPGLDLYQICPEGGLRSGDKFTIQIAEELTDWGHYNFSPRWTARVIVR